MGIDISKPTINWSKMQDYKQSMIDQNTPRDILSIQKNNVVHIKGWARIKNNHTIEVNSQLIQTRNVIIATGSEPSSLGEIKIDEEKIVSSTGILNLKKYQINLL